MRRFLTGCAALMLVAACSEDQEPAPAADLEAGRELARAECAGCHGLDGRGKRQDIPNLAAQSADYLVESLHAYKDGRREHAALQDMTADLSDANIRDIAAYYAGLPAVQPASAPVPEAAGSAFYAEGAEVAAICNDCHGENGFSTEPGVPSLAGQQPAYLIASTQEYVKGNRAHPEKEAMLRGLEQLDIEKMAMYFAAQHPPVRPAPPFGDPAEGEPLSASCGECHGSRGISHDPLVPSLAAQEPHYLVEAIKAYQDHQRVHENMMTDLTDAEIRDIAAFYTVQRAEAAADESLAVRELAAKCDRCHGPAVGASAMIVPTLRGQNREYLVNVMKDYRGDDRGSSMMHKMSADYSDDMIEAIATYYARQSPEQQGQSPESE